MTQLEQQMQAELIVTQTLCNYLADYLTLKGVPSTSDEGLDTLVPKVLLISSGGSIEHDDTLNKNGNPDFLHITQAEKDDFAIKAYAYERVNVAPTIALKLATQTAIVQTLTSANTFAITLPTPRLNKINESIITFKIGSTVPNITYPANLKWYTDEIVLRINSTRTLVFEQKTFDGVNFETWVSCDKNV